MINTHPTRFALLLVLLLASTGIHAAWETTRFAVYEGRTVKTADWLERERGAEQPVLSQALIADIEDYLGQSAKRYADMGFPDPVAAGTLDSVVMDADGKPAIRVYVRPIPGAPYAYYTSGKSCSEPETPRKALNINTLGFKAGGLRGTDYATLSHELFHAVMEASAFMQQDRCDRGGWITEGMPDAISHYMASQLRDTRFREELAPGQALIGKVFGARPYSQPLNLPAAGDYEYFTSSFWRYLAELTAASRRAEKHPGARPYAEDYRYLVDFLGTKYPYGRGPVGEITWLDQAMRQHRHIRSSLASVYAQFVSAFSDHVNWRINPRKQQLGYPASESSAWLRAIVGGCSGAAPADRERPSTLEVFIRENAASCFRLNTAPGLTAGTVVVQVSSENLALLKQLRMGLPDGTLVSAPLIKSRDAETAVHIGQWNFPLLRADGEEFIITNMADQPATTVAAKITLHISVDSWNSSMTPAIPAGEQPPPAAGSGQRSRRDQLKQRTREALAKPVQHLQPTTSVVRSLPDARCSATERQFNTCSSQLVVKLRLSPLVLAENALAGPTVGPELMMQSVAAVGGAAALQAQMQAGQELENFLLSIEADEITIRLPHLDYGFTGDLDNASIEVARAGGGRYRSYGPRVPLGTGFISRPPNGRVTVAEYTPLTMRGTFSADLVDPDNPGPDVAPIVSRSISGVFLSPSPYLRDENFVLDPDQVMQEGLQNTIKQAPFGSDAVQGIVRESGVSAASLCARGADEKLLRSLGFVDGCGNAGGQAQAACSCDCAEREREEREAFCERSCRRQWRDCPLWEGDFPTDLEGQVRALREIMSRQEVPPAMQDIMVESFRDAPEQARLMMLESYR